MFIVVFICTILWSSSEFPFSFSNAWLKQRQYKQHQYHSECLLVLTHEQNEILHNNEWSRGNMLHILIEGNNTEKYRLSNI